MLAERLASSHSKVTSKCHLSIVNTKCSYVNTYLGRPAASVDEGRFVEIDTHGGEEVKRAKAEKWARPLFFTRLARRGRGSPVPFYDLSLTAMERRKPSACRSASRLRSSGFPRSESMR